MLTQIVRFKLLKKHFNIRDAYAIAVGIKNNKIVIGLPKLQRKIYLRPNSKDLETFKEIFLCNLYDQPLPFDPKTIVDAGANVGFATLFFKLKYPQASIFAIEIEAQNAEFFKKNTTGLSNLTLAQKAIYHSEAFFKIENPYDATNSFQIRQVSDSESFDTAGITIDQIMAEQSWTTVDILKIDIEGAEKQLFSMHYEKWLPKIKVIMIETHDRMVDKCSFTVMNTLNLYNFILYTTTEGTLIYYNLDYVTLP